jgi:hypothetical protein
MEEINMNYATIILDNGHWAEVDVLAIFNLPNQDPITVGKSADGKILRGHQVFSLKHLLKAKRA